MARWTREQDDVLREYAAKGLSASQIATMIASECGIGVSRSAVIGRADRIGVELGPTPHYSRHFRRPSRVGDPEHAPETYRPRQAPRPRRNHVNMNKHGAPLQNVDNRGRPPAPMPAPRPHPDCEAVSFMDLAEDRCHWPVGDKFCGAEIKNAPRSARYCAFHRGHSTGSTRETESLVT